MYLFTVHNVYSELIDKAKHMRPHETQAVIKGLQHAIEHNSETGICHVFYSKCSNIQDIDELKRKLVKSVKDRGWYSGVRTFPIEHPLEAIDPRFAYMNESDRTGYFDHTDEYCQRRIQIAKDLIEVLSNETV